MAEPNATRQDVLMERWGLIALVVMGGGLRLWALDRMPLSLNQDEAVGGYDAYCLWHTLSDHHGTFLPVLFESFEDWVSPLLTYLTVPFVGLFGLSETVVRLPTALAGTASIPLMYALIQRFEVPSRVALAGAGLLAVSPWHVPLSRWAIPPSLVTFTMLLALLAFHRAIEAKGRAVWGRWLGFVLSAALWTYSYPTQKLFAPLVVLGLLLTYVRPRLRVGVPVWLGYVALISPMYILVFKDPQRYNARFNMMRLPLEDALDKPQLIWEVLIRYGEYLSPDFFFGRGDTNLTHHVSGYGAISPIVAAFFYLGIAIAVAVSLKRWPETSLIRNRAIELLILLVLYPIPSVVVYDRLQLNRTVHGFPIAILFVSIGLSHALSWLREVRHVRLVCLTLLTVLAIETPAWVSVYWSGHRRDWRFEFQYGLKQVFEKSIALESQYDEVHVNNWINQPYIYYLFYSKKDPDQLDYREINENATPGSWLSVSRIGKWRFREFKPGELDGATELHVVRTGKRIWHRLLAKGKRLYIE